MSRTDKDTPFWVIAKTHPTRYARHNHTRANNHGVLASNGEHYCSIAEESQPGKKHHLGRMVWSTYETRLKQHIASGACKKSYTMTIVCDHNIFDHSINNRYGCTRLRSWHSESAWTMRQQGYTWDEIGEWVDLNGIVFSHEVTRTFRTPNTPCKCNTWTFYDDCTYEINWKHLDHGLTGWGQSQPPCLARRIEQRPLHRLARRTHHRVKQSTQ